MVKGDGYGDPRVCLVCFLGRHQPYGTRDVLAEREESSAQRAVDKNYQEYRP